MNPLKIEEIKDMEPKALKAKVNDLRVELFNLKMKKKTTGLEKPHFVGIIRKNIARLMMVLGEKTSKTAK